MQRSMAPPASAAFAQELHDSDRQVLNAIVCPTAAWLWPKQTT
jgi:hypothetical protein